MSNDPHGFETKEAAVTHTDEDGRKFVRSLDGNRWIEVPSEQTPPEVARRNG